MYIKLKSLNTNILNANCFCHIVHNCLKRSLNMLSIDFDNIIQQYLICFHQFYNSEFKKLIKLCPTIWVSLLPAVNQILISWPALKAYFEDLAENNKLPKL